MASTKRTQHITAALSARLDRTEAELAALRANTRTLIDEVLNIRSERGDIARVEYWEGPAERITAALRALGAL